MIDFIFQIIFDWLIRNTRRTTLNHDIKAQVTHETNKTDQIIMSSIHEEIAVLDNHKSIETPVKKMVDETKLGTIFMNILGNYYILK